MEKWFLPLSGQFEHLSVIDNWQIQVSSTGFEPMTHDSTFLLPNRVESGFLSFYNPLVFFKQARRHFHFSKWEFFYQSNENLLPSPFKWNSHFWRWYYALFLSPIRLLWPSLRIASHKFTENRFDHLSFLKSYVTPPQICITIVFDFSWDIFISQEKSKTMIFQNFGVILIMSPFTYCIRVWGVAVFESNW